MAIIVAHLRKPSLLFLLHCENQFQLTVIIAKTERRVRAAAAGVFPLGFRRQAISLTFHVTQLFAERHSVVPADAGV
jgi:hypothetical protein